MKPQKEKLAADLLAEYYPQLNLQWQIFDQKYRQNRLTDDPEVVCQWPAPYIMTQSIKLYRTGLQTETADPSKPLGTELQRLDMTVIPRRVTCVQCREVFNRMEDFRAHIS